MKENVFGLEQTPNKLEIYSATGPTGSPKCPKCLNSLQNARAHGTESVYRCASCKYIWEYIPLSDKDLEDIAKNLAKDGIKLSESEIKLRDYTSFEEILKNDDIYLSVSWNPGANCYSAYLNDLNSYNGIICQGNGVNVACAIANLKGILWPKT